MRHFCSLFTVLPTFQQVDWLICYSKLVTVMLNCLWISHLSHSHSNVVMVVKVPPLNPRMNNEMTATVIDFNTGTGADSWYLADIQLPSLPYFFAWHLSPLPLSGEKMSLHPPARWERGIGHWTDTGTGDKRLYLYINIYTLSTQYLHTKLWWLGDKRHGYWILLMTR